MTPGAFTSVARSDPHGRIAEAIIMLRGKLTHFLASDIEPRGAHLYPSNNLFPGETTIMGDTLRWPIAARVLAEHCEILDHPAWLYYESSVGQMPVRLSLAIAQEFLLDESVIG